MEMDDHARRRAATSPGTPQRTAGAAMISGNGGWVTMTLPYRAPYDWDALISFLMTRAISGVEVVTPHQYVRSIQIGRIVGLLAVSSGPQNTLTLGVCEACVPALSAIAERTRRLFDLAAEQDEIGRVLSADPFLAPMIAVRLGLRIPGAWDGFRESARGPRITLQCGRLESPTRSQPPTSV